MSKLSKKLLFTHEGEIYMLFRGKNPMLLKVVDASLVVVDHYGTPLDDEKLDRLLKVLWRWFVYNH